MKVAQSIELGGFTLFECGTLSFKERTNLYPADTHVWSTLINGKCYYTSVEQIGSLVAAGLI